MTTHSSTLAPIALFVYKRPEHTRRTLEGLAKNPEFCLSPLHVFCDAAKGESDRDSVDKTRRLLRDLDHPNKTLHISAANLGLANSIVGGVTSLCERYGRVIVIEDDLVVAPCFLAYLNSCLDAYASEPRVMQVSGHMFPVDLQSTSDSVLLPFTTSWGWATWARAWVHFDASAAGAGVVGRSIAERIRFDLGGSYPYFKMLQRQLDGEVDSWAIRWYLSVYMQSGLTLYPRVSLVDNIGFDGSGTHCTELGPRTTGPMARGALDAGAGELNLDEDAFMKIKKHLREQRGLAGSLRDWANRLLPLSAWGAANGR